MLRLRACASRSGTESVPTRGVAWAREQGIASRSEGRHWIGFLFQRMRDR